MSKTCGACKNALFDLTPTGRIKKGKSARCAKADEIKKAEIVRKLPPCVTRQYVHIAHVWPDYDANDCKHWEPIK